MDSPAAPIPALPLFISQKFRFWSFVSMFLLVYVHGYNLHISYLQPWTVPGEPLRFTTFTEYFVANGILRFRIPMLFIISGYLFALHDYRPYRERTRKRLRTLLLPYLIWSGAGLLLTYAFEFLPYTRDIIAGSKIVQISDHQFLLHDYHWYEILFRWIFIPVPYQLWFIRVLLIYNLAYPAIKWCVLHPIARWIFFGLAFLMWLATLGFVIIEGEGLLFFSLGILLCKTNINIEIPSSRLRPALWFPVFILLAALKTWLAFKGEPLLGQAIYPVLSLLHKAVILSGLLSAWYGCDTVVKWCMNKSWFTWTAAFSFMIYAFHAPLVAYATVGVFQITRQLPFYRLLTYLLLPLLIVALAVSFGALLRRFAPWFYGILTGGRGF